MQVTVNMNRINSNLLQDETGSILIAVAVSLVALLSFCIIAIDGAILLTTKTQLQNAADSAALAAASGLLEQSEDTATQRAIDFAGFNDAVQSQRAPVVITPDDVDFLAENVVRVTTHRTRATNDPLRTYFLRVVNPFHDNLADVTAVAAAQAFDVCSSRCLKPWAIPDRWNDDNGNNAYDAGELYDPDLTGYVAPADVGASIILKVGNPQQTITPGQFYPINYPPLDHPDSNPLTGGDWYRQWMVDCEPFSVGIGDRLQVEPGNMVGPTTQGVEELIAQDPEAWWDPATQTIQGSNFGLSPRIGLIPFFDPTQPPTSGRNWVTVTKVGAFFIEGIGQANQVVGRFIQVTQTGSPCPGGGIGNSLIKGIALIE